LQSFKLVGVTELADGVLFDIQAGVTTLQVKFTNHASERIKRWDLTREMVLETLLFPEEVLRGHRGRFIAHRRYGKHLVRAIYEYDQQLPSVVTAYFPYSERYFQGGSKYEGKIFP
jgi:hypothetical protein